MTAKSCCMCRRVDSNVRTLNSGTRVHNQCLELAALSKLADEGWKDENERNELMSDDTIVAGVSREDVEKYISNLPWIDATDEQVTLVAGNIRTFYAWLAGNGSFLGKSPVAELPDSMPPELVVAMTLWGECRGECSAGKSAVLSVIYNRARIVSARHDIPFMVAASKVCLQKSQFSCWNDGKFVQQEPDYGSEAWVACGELAKTMFGSDYRPTIPSTHYFAISMNNPPSWASKMEFLGEIGSQKFYKDQNWRG